MKRHKPNEDEKKQYFFTQAKYNEEFRKTLACARCLKLPFDTRMLICGHLVCGACYDWLTLTEKLVPTCPKCKQTTRPCSDTCKSGRGYFDVCRSDFCNKINPEERKLFDSTHERQHRVLEKYLALPETFKYDGKMISRFNSHDKLRKLEQVGFERLQDLEFMVEVCSSLFRVLMSEIDVDQDANEAGYMSKVIPKLNERFNEQCVFQFKDGNEIYQIEFHTLEINLGIFSHEFLAQFPHEWRK